MKYLKRFDTSIQYENYIDSIDLDDTPNVSAVSIPVPAVHYMKKTWPEFIDMGTGVLWMSHNLGAESPYDAGLYFAWGETVGYKENQVGIDRIFDWTTYKFSNGGGNASAMTKYNSTDNKGSLDLIDDAARQMMGNGFFIPGRTDWMNLINNSSIEFDSVTGCKVFTSNINGNKLYLPAAGYATTSVMGVGTAYYWSSTLLPEEYQKAYILFAMSSNYNGIEEEPRKFGHPIRACFMLDVPK